jgi:hypothetical protein
MRWLTLLLLLAGCSPVAFNSTGHGIVTGRVHPASQALLNEQEAGRYDLPKTFDSGGGNMVAWRQLAEAAKAGEMPLILLDGDCSSACLLFAVSASNSGSTVYFRMPTALRWHGAVTSRGALVSDVDRERELLRWKEAGLPEWAFEAARRLKSGEVRDMTPAEIARAGLRLYE